MKLGIIGGSGLYSMPGLAKVRRRALKTAFGAPSDAFVCGQLDGCEVVFLPRHGVGHRLLPSEINHRANVMGLKMLGVEQVISISAVGSLREEIRPGDVVLPDQYYDRTKSSVGHTFFGKGLVAHVAFGQPTCAELRSCLVKAVRKVTAGKDVRLFDRGTYVNMEGPAFSTLAESNVYRKLGFDVIGMTSLAEAKLCREAELCYQGMALATDYDCWHRSEASVTVEALLKVLHGNAALAQEVVRALVGILPPVRACRCGDSLQSALVTEERLVPAATCKALRPIVGRYWKR